VSNGDGVFRINGSNLEKISDALGSTTEASITSVNNCEFVDKRFLVWETQEETSAEETLTFYRFDCKVGGWSTCETVYDISSTEDVLPTLTSDDSVDNRNAAKDDFLFYASSGVTSYEIYKAFDDNPSTTYRPYSFTPGLRVQVTFPDENTDIICKYTITTGSNTNTPKKWQLYGHQGDYDSSTRVLLDSREDEEFTANEKRTFTFDTDTHYHIYQFSFEESNDSTIYLCEIEFIAKTNADDNYTEWQSNDINFKSPINAKEIPRFHVEFDGTVDLELYKDGTLSSTTNLVSTSRTNKIIYGDNTKFHRMNYKVILKDTDSYFYSIDIPNVKR